MPGLYYRICYGPRGISTEICFKSPILNFFNENIKNSFNNPTSVANLPLFIIKQMALLVVSINNIGQ